MDEGKACSNINKKLNKVSIEESECTIYKVYRNLREVNPKAYEPEIIAIGPYHRHKDDLKMMEDHKLRYFYLLLQRIGKNVEIFVSTIAPLESRARRSYAEPIILESAEFIEMLILDGCFIIEFVNKYYSEQRNDPIFDLLWVFNSLVRDLMLFENQIPFFVLNELSQVVFEVPNQHQMLTNRLQVFFYVTCPLQDKRISSPDVLWYDIKHLLDLMHQSWCPAPPLNSTEKKVQFIESATRLEVANVEFQRNENVNLFKVIKHLLDLMHRSWCPAPPLKSTEKKVQFIESATRLEEANVKFQRNENVNLFKVEFKNGTILMPPLIIDDGTEFLFRNLIAYEQYFINKSPNSITYMSDYALFLDRLVDSSKDIEILCRNGIIENWLGDEEVVAKIVNKLCVSVAGAGDGFIFSDIFDRVNKHCKKRRNRWMAKLRRNYLNSPWAIISVVAASVLLVLTATQTVFAILQGV